MAVSALAIAMIGLSGVSANAAPVDTRFATLVSSGSTFTVTNDYYLVSKWFALGAVIWAVVWPVLAIYFGIRLYKHYNISMHLVSNIGMAAIGLPPSLTLFAEQFGFLKIDGGLNAPSAWIACTSVVCMTIINSIKHLFAPQSLGVPAPQPLQPLVSGPSEPDTLQLPNKSQAMAAKVVEDGMPSPEAVVKYLIETMDTVDGDDAYSGLRERLRSGVCNIILNQHPRDTIIQGLNAAAPPSSPLAGGMAFTLVLNCRKSARNRIDSFIGKVDLFKEQLERYRTRATRT